MVNILIVSHSHEIAEGVKKLALEMAQGEVEIIGAGGMEDGSIGTDAMKIKAALEALYTEDGVLVLADLGSAIMSTQMAMEFLEGHQQERIVIADAPLVEGAIGAAVQASIGSTLEEVKAAAEDAKNLKKL